MMVEKLKKKNVLKTSPRQTHTIMVPKKYRKKYDFLLKSNYYDARKY